MAEQGVENPTDEEVRRFDRTRKKKGSNQEWESPVDPDSRIAKMKDGRTHLAYKAEHVVDLESEFVVAAPVYAADQADPSTLVPEHPEGPGEPGAGGGRAGSDRSEQGD